MNDADFDKLLKNAKGPMPKTPPSFQHEVWLRIESSAAAAPRNAFSWLDAFWLALSRPASAAMAVTVMVAIGLWLGASPTQRDTDNSRAAYVAAVSPFAQSHHHAQDTL